jgi:hypothetical protein
MVYSGAGLAYKTVRPEIDTISLLRGVEMPGSFKYVRPASSR